MTQSTELSYEIQQVVLTCKVIDALTYTYQNGIWHGCKRLGEGWNFPPSTFNGNVSDEITGFWIGGRLRDGKWINDQDEEIDKPVTYLIY